MPKLISIIIPLHNEAENILPIRDAIGKIFLSLDNYDLEIIFVDDGSTDESAAIIRKLSEEDPRVRPIEFTRNFGKEMATTCGLNRALGDAAIILDADLQHPPEKIPEFIRCWENGCEMVVGIREENKDYGLIRKICNYIFYKAADLLSETDFVPNTTDFRLVDRIVIDEFNRFTEHSRMTRGLLDWLGFHKCYVKFTANLRMSGETDFNNLKLAKLAISAIISHSLFPLKLAGYLGIAIILFSGPLGLFIFVNKFVFNDPFGFAFSGPAILAVILLFLVGIILLCLGLIALYIGNIQNEVINRPMYVVRSRKLSSYKVIKL